MIYNFGAGPSALPKEVMLAMQDEFLEFGDAKSSVIEMSHRGKQFADIYHNIQHDLRELMSIPDNYHILLAQGGASLQFAMVPLNLLGDKTTISYAVTGHWGKKAVVEAKKFANVNIVTDSSYNKFTDIDDISSWQIADNSAYLHYVDNETIAGLQFNYIPDITNIPLVCDMSSSILAKPIDISKFGVIYAGAQKNIGASGLTIIIIRDDLIGNANAHTPTLLNYQTYYKDQSLYNTPSTFAWYSAYKVFKWLKQQNLTTIQKNNITKAKILYDYIDSTDFYINKVNSAYRSIMNVPFTLIDSMLDSKFLTQSYDNDLIALKGHKSVGGMRASIYNSMTIDGVKALVKFMDYFAKKYG